MYRTSAILASAALMASTALASSPGSAVVVNACTYPVYLSAVPSADGGYSQKDVTLQPKDSWSQQWTELTNGNGWSIKLSQTQELDNILQYEYTFQNDGIIWYDLSCVNGNPWDGNWEVTSAGDSQCKPKQSYYRFATDDAYGMQSCASGASVTVTLCSGESQADSAVSAVQASTTPQAVASSSPAATSTTSTSAEEHTQAHSSAAAAAAATTGSPLGWNGEHFVKADVVNVNSATPTTFATSTTAVAVDNNGDVVTVVETVIETAVAYETVVPGKRHVHHPNHPHFR